MTTNKKSNKYNKMAILAIILVMPGLLFYFLQQKAENRYQSLPILGPKTLSGTFHSKRGVQIPDTVFHQVTPFSLINEDETLVQFPMDQESISIVNFFYTHCDTFCLETNRSMSKLANIFSKNEIIKFYSLSVDSTDTPEVLKEYVYQFDKENTHWEFLTSNDERVLEISRSEFLLDALADTSKHHSFIISPYLVLLDSRQQIRGYYDGSESKQMDQLIDEIKLLVTEELRLKNLY